jgi:hypothetical protein
MQTSTLRNAFPTPRATFAARSIRLRTLLVIVLAFTASACDVPQGDVSVNDGGPTPIPFQRVGFGMYEGTSDLETVVRTDAQWQRLSDSLAFLRPAQLRGDTLGGAMILVAGAQAPFGGHALRFIALEQDSSGVEATYVLLVPGEECTMAPAPQQPFFAIKAPRIDAPIRFTRVVEETPCVID